MRPRRTALFRKRQFEPVIIVTCVRWYCRFSLSLRDLEELMAERGLALDHTTIWRWVQRYGPEVHRWLRGNVKQKSSTWHMDETFVRIAGRWLYLSGRWTAMARRWIFICRRRGIAKQPNTF